jgi:hypothetical protein
MEALTRESGHTTRGKDEASTHFQTSIRELQWAGPQATPVLSVMLSCLFCCHAFLFCCILVREPDTMPCVMHDVG